jgi:hypothetical protein
MIQLLATRRDTARPSRARQPEPAALKGLDPYGSQFGFDTDVLAACRLCVDRCAVLGEHPQDAAHTRRGRVDPYVGHRFADVCAGVVQSLHQDRRRQLAEVGGGAQRSASRRWPVGDAVAAAGHGDQAVVHRPAVQAFLERGADVLFHSARELLDIAVDVQRHRLVVDVKAER